MCVFKLKFRIIELLKFLWNYYNSKIRLYQTKIIFSLDSTKPLPTSASITLVNVCDVLEKGGVSSFSIGWGTALGIYRNGALIPHDNDLDLDVFNYSDYPKIVEILKSVNFEPAIIVSYREKIQQIAFVLKESGVVLDVVFWNKKSNKYFNYCEPGYKLVLPCNLVDKTSKINFAGSSISIPLYIEDYLSTIYGNDWRIPKISKGDWKKDCYIIHKRFDPVFWSFYYLYPFYCKYFKKNNAAGLSEISSDFLLINHKFWSAIPVYETKFLADLTVIDHEYLNVHLITTRFLMHILKARPVALLNSSKDQQVINLAKSYGVHEFIFLDKINVSIWLKIWFSFYALFVWFFSRSKESLLNIKYKNIIIGHYIYDTFLISNGIGTVRWWNVKFAKYIRFALILYKKFEKIFDDDKYVLFLGSEQVYLGSGISSAISLSRGVEVLYRKHGPNVVAYKKYSKLSDLDLFTTHPVKDDFEEVLNNDFEDALKWADKYIINLFNGNVPDYDWNAKNAYGNAKKLDKGSFDKFFDKKYKYHVFIFSHVFVDAVHGYREGLFPDYETWLRETLKIASQRKDVMWIIKPHPSDGAYSTKSNSVEVYKDFAKFDNIKLFPANTLTSDLVENIDAILTMRGTAAGEYSCVGVPVITAGRSMFDEGNFCITPKNLGEYKDVLLHAEFKRLSDEVIKRAKIYMYVYNNSGRIDMPLLSDLESTGIMAPSVEEIYSHLSYRMKNMKEEDVFNQDYKNYIINKLNKI